MDFQQIILTLQKFWSEQNCILAQPYDIEKGAGTMNPSTSCASWGRNRGAWPTWSRPAALPTGATVTIRTACSSTTSSRSSSNRPRRISRTCIWTAWRPWALSRKNTTSVSSKTTGNRRPSALGAWAGKSGSTAWKSRSSRISSRSAAWISSPSPWKSRMAWNVSPCISRAWKMSMTSNGSAM